MEKYDEFMRAAKQSLSVGEHVLKITYPLLKESKLLLAVLERMHAAQMSAMQAILTAERERRTIPPFHANWESMLNTITLRLKQKYDPSGEVEDLVRTVAKTLEFHKEAAVAFGRRGELVLASDSYVIQKVTPESVTEAMRKTQRLITDWSQTLNSHL